MKAAVFFETGGPEVIQLQDLPDPVAGTGEVVIRPRAIGLNFADVYRRRGEYPVDPPSPFVLGHEGAGFIESVGPGVRNLAVGDRVAFAHVPRANAELVKAPAWKVVPLPSDISFETASGLMLQGLTAHYLTHSSFKLLGTETILIHSASGGVGMALLQLGQELGVRSIGTVSSRDKVAIARLAGADEVIVRSDGDWVQAVLELTNGAGVDVAYDAIGSTLEESLRAVKPRGAAVYYGWAGGRPPKIDPAMLMDSSKTLIGGDLWSHIDSREALLARADSLFSLVRTGKFSVHVSKHYPLVDTASAHRAIESGKTHGKLLLIP